MAKVLEHYCRQDRVDKVFTHELHLECGCVEYVCELCYTGVIERPDGGCGNNKNHENIVAHSKVVRINE